jgi:hypothetical protein
VLAERAVRIVSGKINPNASVNGRRVIPRSTTFIASIFKGSELWTRTQSAIQGGDAPAVATANSRATAQLSCAAESQASRLRFNRAAHTLPAVSPARNTARISVRVEAVGPNSSP